MDYNYNDTTKSRKINHKLQYQIELIFKIKNKSVKYVVREYFKQSFA